MHSRSTTRTRRDGATFASAETTIGTLPNGSMTSSSSTAAENASAIGITLIAENDALASRIGAADPAAWRADDHLHAAGLVDDARRVPERLQPGLERCHGSVLLELGRTIAAAEVRQCRRCLRIELPVDDREQRLDDVTDDRASAGRSGDD